MLSMIVQGGAIVGLLGGSLAAFLYVPVPFKRWTVYACVGAALWLLAYNAGYRSMYTKCAEASAAYQARIVKRDLEIVNNAAAHERELAEARQAAEGTLQEKVAQYEKQLKSRSGCSLTGPDADRLRDIR